MKKKRLVSILALMLCAVVLTAALAACSSNSAPSATAAHSAAAAPGKMIRAEAGLAQSSAADEAAQPTTSGAAAEGTSSSPSAIAAASNQKIIERLSYVIETLKFDESVGRIQSLCTSLGGYVQDSAVTGNGIASRGNLRQATYTLRIPQEKLAQMKSRAGEIGSVLNFSSNSENVSDKYFDTEARLKSLRTQQERLMALLQKSGTLADIISLEKALADVNYQIEQYTTTLKQYDSLINYSTVSIQLQEVVKPTEVEREPVTLWERISSQFQQSLKGLGSFGEGLAVFFIGCSPVLILLLIIALVIYWFVWGKKKRAAKRLTSEEKKRVNPIQSEPEHKEDDTPSKPEE